jgi:hypothetical protein
VVFPVSSGIFEDCTLKLGHDGFLPHIFFSIQHSPVILSFYIMLSKLQVTEKASLSELQINNTEPQVSCNQCELASSWATQSCLSFVL